MAPTSIGTVYDRISSVVAAQGFRLSLDPFSFDQQPSHNLDKTFRLETSRTSATPYLGGDQADIHHLDVWITRLAPRDPHGTARQLKVDLDLIEQAINADRFAGEYYILDAPEVTSEVQLPADENAAHVIGRLSADLDFDRDL